MHLIECVCKILHRYWKCPPYSHWSSIECKRLLTDPQSSFSTYLQHLILITRSLGCKPWRGFYYIFPKLLCSTERYSFISSFLLDFFQRSKLVVFFTYTMSNQISWILLCLIFSLPPFISFLLSDIVSLTKPHYPKLQANYNSTS